MLGKIDSKKFLTLMIVVVLSVSTVFSAAFATATSDYVSPWARDTVLKAQTYGILPGTLIGQNMTQAVSRSDYAKIMVLLYEKSTGKTASSPAVSPFEDTEDTDIMKAYSLGVVRGMGGGIFDPESNLTREQSAVMLTRIYTKISGSKLMATNTEAFSDDKTISAYAKPSVYFMVNKGFIQGTGHNNFAPKANATREQTIAMAVRMFEAVKEMPAVEPQAEYSPGMQVATLEAAIEIIKSGEKDLAPEITMAVEKELYESLLKNPFVDGTGIDSLHYVYNSNTGMLAVKISYSLYAQIMALSINPGATSIYASDDAKKFNGDLDGVLSEIITPVMGIYDKEKAVHDYMVTHYKYDTTLTEYDLEHPSLSIAGLLYHETGGCTAYAEMFNVLMTKLGIGVKMVHGFAGGNEHIWNMVRLSGNWYMVDVTWDDPAPDRGLEISYDYFNATDDVISKDHTWDRSSYPSCISTEYNTVNRDL